MTVTFEFRRAVEECIRSFVPSSRILGSQGADVASANNLQLGRGGNGFVITGSTQINLMDSTGWTADSLVTLFFPSALTIKHAYTASGTFLSFYLRGLVDASVPAGASMTFRLINGVWLELARGFTDSPIKGRFQEAQGANVASANNMTLGLDGNAFNITGTTQINLLDATGWQAGAVVRLFFVSSLTVKHAQAPSGAFVGIYLSNNVDFVPITNSTLSLACLGNAWLEVGRKV